MTTSLSQTNKNLAQRLLIPVAFFLITFLIYSNTLDHDFLLDDITLILSASLSSLDFLQLSGNGANAVYFRPLVHIFCALNHHLFGTNPVGYHAVNLLIFYAAGLSFYYLISRLFNHSLLALVSGLLFITHPINGVLVNYKTTTGYGFLLLAANLALLQVLKDHPKKTDFALSAVWFFSGLLCHETMVAFPLYLAAMLLIARQKTVKETFLACRFHIVALVAYLVLRAGYVSDQANVFKNFASSNLSALDITAVWAKLFQWYFSQLLSPAQIVLVQEKTVLPSETVLWNFIFVLALSAGTLMMFHYKNNRPALLGLSWLAISFLPITLASISRPEMGFIIQPHWLSFGSLGFFLWLSSILCEANKTFRPPLWLLMMTILLSSYTVSSIVHNTRWSDQKTYCHYWVESSPNNFWVNFNLGESYLAEKNYPMARHYFLRAVKDGKAGFQVWKNLGFTEYNLGNYEEAKKYFLGVLKGRPGDTVCMDYLQMIQANKPTR